MSARTKEDNDLTLYSLAELKTMIKRDEKGQSIYPFKTDDVYAEIIRRESEAEETK